MRLSRRLLTAPVATLALIATPLALTQAPAVATAPRPSSGADQAVAVPVAAATARTWTPRDEQYPATMTTTDLAIMMSDGVTLRGDLTLPANATGVAVDA